MQLEPNHSLTDKQRKAMRIAVICAIIFGIIMIVLTAMDLLIRTAGFIIVYAVLIALCVVLLVTVLRDDGTGSTAAPGVRSEEQVISDAVLALNAKKQEDEDAQAQTETHTEKDMDASQSQSPVEGSEAEESNA
jgi:predicted tellurium resistance membrane protein TerC